MAVGSSPPASDGFCVPLAFLILRSRTLTRNGRLRTAVRAVTYPYWSAKFFSTGVPLSIRRARLFFLEEGGVLDRRWYSDGRSAFVCPFRGTKRYDRSSCRSCAHYRALVEGAARRLALHPPRQPKSRSHRKRAPMADAAHAERRSPQAHRGASIMTEERLETPKQHSSRVNFPRAKSAVLWVSSPRGDSIANKERHYG